MTAVAADVCDVCDVCLLPGCARDHSACSPESPPIVERTFVCRFCSGRFPARSTTGALPSTCDGCEDPEARKRRLRRSEHSAYQRLRQENDDLRRQVADLQEALRFDEVVATNVGTSGRNAVARAVRNLAHAQGRVATRAALADLAAAARGWHQHLASRADDLPNEGGAMRETR